MTKFKLILLPGMEGSGEFFAPLIEVLGSSVATQIIRYPQDIPLNYPQLTELVKQELPKNTPYVVLGESFSGPIAVTIAATKPAGLQAVILACSFVRSPIPVPKTLRKLVSLFPASWVPLTLIAHFLLGKQVTIDRQAHLGRVLSQVTNRVFRERLLSILDVDVSQKLPEITVPLLYLRATEDKIVPSKAAKLIVAQQPNTIIADIEGPHFLLQTQPGLAVSHILAFLQSLNSTPKQDNLIYSANTKL